MAETMIPPFEALERLQDRLRRTPRAALLFSGGLDSSLLLAVAARTLGPGLCATAPREAMALIRFFVGADPRSYCKTSVCPKLSF